MNTKKSVNSELSYEQYVAWCRMSVPDMPSSVGEIRASEAVSETVAAPASGASSGPVTVRSNREGHVIISHD